MHEEKGIKFELNAGVKEFVGENGFVSYSLHISLNIKHSTD